MNLYRPQQEVFLFGQFALFSNNFADKKFDATQLVHLFPSGLVAALRQYEKEGYFTVETTLDTSYIDQQNAIMRMESRVDIGFSGNFTRIDENYNLGKVVYDKVKKQLPLATNEVDALLNSTTSKYLRFKIININKERFKKELVEYLSDYKNDDLTTGREIDPVNFASQQTELLNAIAKYRQQYGDRPTIKSTDVTTTTFWELVLTHQLITGDIEMINMGYDDRSGEIASGISYRHTGTVAFAKLRVMNDRLRETIMTETVATSDAKIPLAARVIMQERSVLIILANGNIYEIASLQENRAPYDFMYHIAVKNNGGDFTLDDIHEGVSITHSRKSLSDLVHDSGFDKILKKIFFGKPTSNAIKFQQGVDLEQSKLHDLEKHLSENYKLVSGS